MPPTNKNDAISMSQTATLGHAITLDTKMGQSIGFWRGCSVASTGCANCYSLFRILPRWYHMRPGQVIVNKQGSWNKPRHWKAPQMVFVCPLSDFFIDHPAVNKVRDKAWDVMRNYPQHIFWITTKRPELIEAKKMLPFDWPFPNIWLGVTTENQHWADKRMPILRNIQVHKDALRFVCAEPLLGPIQFAGPSTLDGYGWITSGGESGDRKHLPRPAKDQWFLDIASQCTAAGVPFNLMQRGGIKKCRCHHDFGCRAIPPGPNGQVFESFPPQVQIISLHDDFPPMPPCP